MRVPQVLVIVTIAAAAAATACARAKDPALLIPATTTMVTAWQIPRNPLDDRSLADSKDARDIRRGYRIFMDTPKEAPQFAHGKVSCGNCHLNAGQRERALPLVGVAGVFPEFNKRSGRSYLLVDRIVDCFWRSENGTEAPDVLPTTTTPEVLAVAAYINWISTGFQAGRSPSWRREKALAADPPDSGGRPGARAGASPLLRR